MGDDMSLSLRVSHPSFAKFLDFEQPLVQVLAGFHFTEGPVWHPYERYLIFSDIIGDTIYRWSPEQGLTVFRRPSHMANGNTFDRQGRLLTCEHATSRLVRTEPDGSITVLATHFEGKALNSPNDVIVKSDGAIYFTDPNSGRFAPYGVPRPQELPFQGVYRWSPETGGLTLLVDDFEKPNGLCFSPDETTLYIADTEREHIRAFDLTPQGRLLNGRVWAEVRGEGIGRADGMKVDREGNVYCAGPGGIHVFSSDAVPIGVILIPEHTANLAWGDDDCQSLYITAASSVYRIRTRIPGNPVF